MLITGSAAVDSVDEVAAYEFKLGDSVWVSGVKKGIIAFIGETQFAPGVWAGVLLDEPVGKNDGSVSGVRYFACEPSHGIFAKLHTLTGRPTEAGTCTPDGVPSVADVSALSDTVNDGFSSSVSGSDTKEHAAIRASVQDISPTTAAGTRPSKLPATGSRPSGLARFSQSSSSSSLSQTAKQSKSQPAVVVPHPAVDVVCALNMDERVVVGGNKAGTLRYFGATHFAKGEWAGVELDEPVGKNDGSVEGKR